MLECIILMTECFKIQQILDVSDEQDREKMGLYGIKESLVGDMGRSDYNLNSMANFANANLVDSGTASINYLN